MKKILTIAFLCINIIASATNYYVSSSGSDSNSGQSTTSPWKTIAKVNSSSFSPGDIIYFNKGNVWAETLTIPSSGISGNPIIFSSYGSGAKPIITGSDTRLYTVNTNNKIYITIDGFDLVHSQPGGLEGSINVGSTTVTGIIIKNCTIEDNRRCGITLKGSSVATDVLIDNCIITNNGQFGILVQNGYGSGTISNCTIHGNGTATVTDNSQMSEIQGNLGNFNISGNTIYNAAALATNPATSHGIYFSSETSNTVNIHNNSIYGNLKGAGIKTRCSANIYNNLIYGNNLESIETGGNGTINCIINIHNNIMYGSLTGFPSVHEDSKGTGTINMTIYNNTFYKSGNLYSSTKELTINDNLTSLNIRNNIFYAADGHGGMDIVLQSAVIIDYNLYWKDNSSGVPYNRYNNADYSTLSNWKALGFDTHGVNADPLIVSSTDLHLKSGSPAVGAGVTISGLITDFTGTAVKTPPSIGAYESGTSVVVPPLAAIPVFQNSAIANATPSLLELTYDLSLNNAIIPAVSSFTAMVNSTPISVSNVGISGTKVQLTLSNAVKYGDVITVAYTKPSTNPLQTIAGGIAASISLKPTTNNLIDPTKSTTTSVTMTLSPYHVHNTVNVVLQYTGISADIQTLSPETLTITDTYGKLFLIKSLITGTTTLTLPLNLLKGVYNVNILGNSILKVSKRIRVF